MKKPKAIVLVAIFLGAAALGGAAVPLTNHPQFCASCHNIRPSYDSWVKSSHKEVECVACHVRPGVEGFIRDKAYAGLKDVSIYLFGTPTDAHNLQATVSSEVCIGCHRAILRVSEVATRDLPPPVKDVGLVMGHKTHMEAFAKRGQGEGCTTCHARVVHEQPIKGYPVVIPRGHVAVDGKPYYPDHPEGSKLRASAMNDCFRCHDGTTEHEGKVLSKKCETCHIPDKIGDFLFN
ncbi:MAG: NapC/NirT family cytochrome c [Nitrospirota bacterium]|nr:NapC/NirT family cytochrome c [Nitrospirota bacterium]MDE3242062.1 NapC/NirT family cytochrome c [Nitrospirota bacterium]